MHPITIVAAAVAAYFGYQWWKKRGDDDVIIIDDDDPVPEPIPDEPDDRPDEPSPKPPKKTTKEKCERDGTCAIYTRAADEEAMTIRFATDVAKSDGANLSEKMPDHSLASDAIRKLRGGVPANRRWRDKNANQSDLSWTTNLTYWMVYPLGPASIKTNSGYAKAWLRIRRAIRRVLDARGVPYTV